MKKLFNIENFTSAVFYLSILIFIIGFNFTDSPPPSGWYQQWMPSSLPNFQVSDVFFLDSLTGWAVTGNSNPNDTSGYILKTTNGGDNWTLKFIDVRDFSRVKFINSTTGFVSGGYYDGARLYKTTNGGDNWFNIYNLLQIYLSDMSVLNEDTIWIVNPISLEGGVYLTTNGGVNWTQQAAFGNNNPSHIYMFNARIGFIDAGGLRRTTDGGASWTLPIAGAGNFLDMYFIDSSTGWKCNQDMKKTTDGGLNWVTQILPDGGMIVTSMIIKFSNINKDTIWAVGGWLQYPNFQSRGLLYRTTNGGNNWLFQIPDTSINVFYYNHNKFVNKLIGWAYSGSHGVHTVTGGNDTFYTSIKQVSSSIPNEYKLFQNYPNPFNPTTTIKFQIKRTAGIKIIVYDIQGRKVKEILNKKFNSGEYEIKFDGTDLSSGVYLYSLFADGKPVDTKKMVLIK